MAAWLSMWYWRVTESLACRLHCPRLHPFDRGMRRYLREVKVKPDG